MSGAEILVAAQIATAVAGVAAAAGSIAEGAAAASEAEFRAEVGERDAQATLQASIFEQEKLDERTKRLLSTQAAFAGESGITLEGSPLLVISETAADAELERAAIEFTGKVGAARLRSGADLARIQGRSAQTGALFGAGTSLLTAGANIGALQQRGRQIRTGSLSFGVPR